MRGRNKANATGNDLYTIRSILIILLLLVLTASVAFGVYTSSYRASAEDAERSFDASFDSGDYAEALRILRDVQEQAASAGPDTADDPYARLYRDALEHMEKRITERVDALFLQGTSGSCSLREEDKVFLEGMEETTGMLVSAKLQQACTDLIVNRMPRSDVACLYARFGNLANISQPVRELEGELDIIEAAAPAVLAAEESLAAERYFDALEQFRILSETHEGFVQSYALKGVETCKDTMIGPLGDQAQRWMESNRYYSARTLLERLLMLFPEDAHLNSLYQKTLQYTAETRVQYSGNVEHITVRPLVTVPSRAFDGDAMQYAISQSMLTASEFRALLDGLYARYGYILIDINRLLDNSGVPGTLRLPEGKKPLVLTLETMNYYPHRAANGLCSRLVLAPDGTVEAEYLDAQGVVQTAQEAESIGIVDAFVAEHPDFSFDGAKGIITVTGYQGVLGYPTNSSQLQQHNISRAELGLSQIHLTESELAENADTVRALAERLRQTGWVFGSSGYSFLNAAADSTTLEVLEQDTDRWLDEVGVLLGDSDVYAYPNGSFLNGDDPRCLMLREKGFRFFSGLGPNAYSFYRENYLFSDKVSINGFTMDREDLSRFFDAVASRDPERP